MAASARPWEDSGGVFVDCNSNEPPVIPKTEPVVEDEDENGQAGQYFVDKVTGEYYFQSSNGDLEQLLAADSADTEVGENTDEDRAGDSTHHEDIGCPDQDLEGSHKVEPRLPPKEEPVQVEEVKKKRGRPVGWRKHQTHPDDTDPDLTSDNLPDEQVVRKKKRGRPVGWRKHQTHTDTSSAEERDDQPEVSCKREVVNIFDDPDHTSSNPTDEQVVRKKKRGRPVGWRKNKHDPNSSVLLAEEENNQYEAVSVSSILDVSKDLSSGKHTSSELVGGNLVNEDVVKKKRGRPKGWRMKKRGRPKGWRKNKADPDSSVLLVEGENDQYEAACKREVGYILNVKKDLKFGSSVDEEVVKKKRGRPKGWRKPKPDPDSSVLLAEGEDDQYEAVSNSEDRNIPYKPDPDTSELLAEDDNNLTVSDIPIPHQNDEEANIVDIFKKKRGRPIGSKNVGKSEKKFTAIPLTPSIYTCSYCNYSTSERVLLKRHIASHSEHRPFTCSVCERGFKTAQSLQNHENSHFGIKPYGCNYCEAKFATSGEKIRHTRYKHTKEKPFKCPDCDYRSVEMAHMRHHIRMHTGERPFQCQHCSYASTDHFKLRRHMRVHTGEKPYGCKVCDATFTQSNALKTHMLVHTSNRPRFQCEICPSNYGRMVDLRNHVQKAHISEIPLFCKMCGESFPDRYTLKIHKRSHQGEKCFKCDLCPYSSAIKLQLEGHMLIHTDQKPFQCDQCDYRCRQKQLLKRHMNLYHNDTFVPPIPKEKTHQCPNCGKCFGRRGYLIKHMVIHGYPQEEEDTECKIERRGKVQVIDGQKVEILTDRNEGEEFTDMAAVDLDAVPVLQEDGEGQHYVYVDVVQLPRDGGGDSQGAGPQLQGAGGEDFGAPLPSLGLGGTSCDIIKDIAEMPPPEISREQIRVKREPEKSPDVSHEQVRMKKELEKELARKNCFGFDDSDDDI